MHAVAQRIDIRIPLVTSLKAKRAILKRLMSGLAKFEVSVSEVDYQDQHRRAALGIAIVAPSAFPLRKRIQTIERWLEAQPDIEVLEVATDHLYPE